MTVKELIDQLSKLDQSKKIQVTTYVESGLMGYEKLRIRKLKVVDGKGAISIHVNLPNAID